MAEALSGLRDLMIRMRCTLSYPACLSNITTFASYNVETLDLDII